MHAIYLLCLLGCIAGKWGPFTWVNTLLYQSVYQSQSLGILIMHYTQMHVTDKNVKTEKISRPTLQENINEADFNFLAAKHLYW